MNTLIKIFAAVVLFFVHSAFLQAQKESAEELEKMLCKAWAIKFEEDNGKKTPATTRAEKSRMVFYKDHNLEFIERGQTETGTWKLDAEKQIVVINDKLNKETTYLKIVTLTETEFIFEADDPGDPDPSSPVRIYMEAVK